MQVHLRRATSDDAEAVADLYVASWNAGLSPLMPPRVSGPDQVARWERDLSSGHVQWWLAEVSGLPVGFTGTGPSRDPLDDALGELDTIAVSPSAWRHGVGRALMGAALQDLRGAGYREAILWTPADHAQGLAFYTATGWQPSGETRDSGLQVALRRSVSRR